MWGGKDGVQEGRGCDVRIVPDRQSCRPSARVIPSRQHCLQARHAAEFKKVVLDRVHACTDAGNVTYLLLFLLLAYSESI